MSKLNWTWKNFTQAEINCNCESCNHELWDIAKYGTEYPFYFVESMNALQDLRDKWKKPIIINSAHRCVIWNADPSVKGGKKSMHLKLAFDCVVAATEQNVFSEMAEECGFNGIGYYPTKGFVHIDIREKAATWYG